jgi:RNA polymerase sigma-70 factor (ECF subfamily)
LEESADFDSFFDQHIGRTQRLLEVMLGDASLAEDAAQEAFARAFRQWGSVAEMTSPAGWVLTVGLNFARDSLRRQNRWLRRPKEPTFASLSSGALIDLDLVSQVRALPLRQRQAIVLHYLEDLPLAEVAVQMNCALGTVKSTLHAAISRLRLNTEVTTK